MKQRITLLLTLLFLGSCYTGPAVKCDGLPGCNGGGKSSNPIEFITNFIGEMIQYVAVFAVFAVMISGIMYIVSYGDEEKAKKAKMGIIWSLIGVLVSVSAWFLVNILNNILIK